MVVSMTERRTIAESTLASRLRGRLRSFEPMYLALLGVLALPATSSTRWPSSRSLRYSSSFPLAVRLAAAGSGAARRDRRGARGADRLAPHGELAGVRGMVPDDATGVFSTRSCWPKTSQWLGTAAVAFVRHRGTFPAVESYDQQVSYRLPFDGTWTVVNGSYDHDYSHSWFPVTQRYAYDFVITDADGRTSPAGSGSAVDSYYCYDEPILALRRRRRGRRLRYRRRVAPWRRPLPSTETGHPRERTS